MIWHHSYFYFNYPVRYVGQRIRSHIMHPIILNNEYIHEKQEAHRADLQIGKSIYLLYYTNDLL